MAREGGDTHLAKKICQTVFDTFRESNYPWKMCLSWILPMAWMSSDLIIAVNVRRVEFTSILLKHLFVYNIYIFWQKWIWETYFADSPSPLPSFLNSVSPKWGLGTKVGWFQKKLNMVNAHSVSCWVFSFQLHHNPWKKIFSKK